MEQLLVLIAGPLDFADAGVEPFCPAGFALFGGFPGEKRGHALPLIQTVFGDGGFEDFVFDIGPDAAFDDGHGGGGRGGELLGEGRLCVGGGCFRRCRWCWDVGEDGPWCGGWLPGVHDVNTHDGGFALRNRV